MLIAEELPENIACWPSPATKEPTIFKYPATFVYTHWFSAEPYTLPTILIVDTD